VILSRRDEPLDSPVHLPVALEAEAPNPERFSPLFIGEIAAELSGGLYVIHNLQSPVA